VAARVGFTHRHFDPRQAADRLARLVELSTGLDRTSERLADDASRRALLDVLKLRVLGPYHARLAISPEEFRAKQAWLDRELREAPATFTVSDPWFSPLSLYRIPAGDGQTVKLHAHSVDLVSVFLLGQYTYAPAVRAEPGDVVLDVGGCWGDTALYFATQVGREGKVYTFEFDPESLEILRANLALNPELAARIEVVERALWDRSGEELGVAPAGRCTSVHAANGNSPTVVSTLTLDDFVAQTGLTHVDFVKMDVEGAEERVLRGARGTLARLSPKLAIAAYHRDDDLVRLPEAIVAMQRGYRCYLGSYSPVEDETVLFCEATRTNSST
jgi:FkbM family methyltransferase